MTCQPGDIVMFEHSRWSVFCAEPPTRVRIVRRTDGRGFEVRLVNELGVKCLQRAEFKKGQTVIHDGDEWTIVAVADENLTLRKARRTKIHRGKFRGQGRAFQTEHVQTEVPKALLALQSPRV